MRRLVVLSRDGGVREVVIVPRHRNLLGVVQRRRRVSREMHARSSLLERSRAPCAHGMLGFALRRRMWARVRLDRGRRRARRRRRLSAVCDRKSVSTDRPMLDITRVRRCRVLRQRVGHARCFPCVPSSTWRLRSMDFGRCADLGQLRDGLRRSTRLDLRRTRHVAARADRLDCDDRSRGGPAHGHPSAERDHKIMRSD